jgi:D-glycero-alpha-D-manno-heptose-7-phosphate kinase
MHELKEQALLTKEAILKGNLAKLGELLDFGWQKKKQISQNISNPAIDEIYSTAISAGATGGKLTGAGGGGFMCFYCPGNTKFSVMEALKKFGGEFRNYKFEESGLTVWRR